VEMIDSVGPLTDPTAHGGGGEGAFHVVLPSLPQFDNPSDTVAVRYTPDTVAGWAAILGLGLILGAVGLAVATLQLRAGRADRLREGVR